MIFELWDTETGNIIGAYEHEDEALAIVHRATQEYGDGYADALVLLRDDEAGNVTTIAAGSALADLARAAMKASIV